MKNQHAPTLIVCPRPRYRNKEEFRSVRFKDSPNLIFGFLDLNDDNESTCSTHPLFWCDNEENRDKLLKCSFCQCEFDNSIGYYLCKNYDDRISKRHTIAFHNKCIQPMVDYPYHPKHPLQVLIFMYSTPNKICFCCYSYQEYFHYCLICNFSICRDCATKPVLLTIDNKKRHDHTLFYIPREASMACDVCALDDPRYFIYICHKCDFVAHKRCIYSPYIIKISCHEHRLSFTSSFIRGDWFCGVCRKKVNENYGGYSCVKGCHYVAHSQCAIYKDVWDGKELEGEPEELYEDITPFKEINDGIIQHFSHKHHMKLQKEGKGTIDGYKRFQACALPIYDGGIFSCMECDFILHITCAYLPLRKKHVMHPHPLLLQEGNLQMFGCSTCSRVCNSFRYVCQMTNCIFKLDVNCAAVSEPVNHQCHPHPLFLPSRPGSTRTCSICQQQEKSGLGCGECDFVFCFRCAIVTMKFTYKYDEHPLIFSYGQSVSNQHWCDVCEEEILSKNGIYMCDACNITLHIKCLLGFEMYMLLGKTVIIGGEENDILPNYHITRYKCKRCHKRCPYNIVYKRPNEAICCSMGCLHRMRLGI